MSGSSTTGLAGGLLLPLVVQRLDPGCRQHPLGVMSAALPRFVSMRPAGAGPVVDHQIVVPAP